MKKIGLIFLSLMLMLMVACSAEDSFLNKVKGKSADIKGETEIENVTYDITGEISFDATGEKADGTLEVGGEKQEVTFTFKSAESETKATYEDGSTELEVTVAGDEISVVVDGEKLSGTLK